MRETGLSICVNAVITTVISALLGKNNSNRALKFVLGLFILISVAAPAAEAIYGFSLSSYAIPAAEVAGVSETVYEKTAQDACEEYLENHGCRGVTVEVEMETDELQNVYLLSVKAILPREADYTDGKVQEIITHFFGIAATIERK